VRRPRGVTDPGPQAPPRQLSRSSHRRQTRLLSPMARAALSADSSNPRLLRAALLLLLLVAAGRRAAGESWRPGDPGAGRGWGMWPPPTAPLNQRVSSSLGAPLANELRCQCLQTLQGIHLKNIQSVEVKRPGPHCDQTEVM
ncbi:hypothetical protein P7K49_006466, partial [Saguinus oedipus]